MQEAHASSGIHCLTVCVSRDVTTSLLNFRSRRRSGAKVGNGGGECRSVFQGGFIAVFSRIAEDERLTASAHSCVTKRNRHRLSRHKEYRRGCLFTSVAGL